MFYTWFRNTDSHEHPISIGNNDGLPNGGSFLFIHAQETMEGGRGGVNEQPLERSDENQLRQPEKCVACLWGRWEGSVQFCMKPVCIKEGIDPALLGTEGR
ncbi:hypothetical protein [Paenibacillus thalictri]|uniref:hypothetical protein n=1 Tax=Paenibacillus thalictri TaxID=2527873 RepID=UPI001034C2C5|nr:hypothetical protein [Paenibacillus thalictri]